jgi:hypothetical protein
MGSPLSSFLAEAVMQDLESKAVTNNDDIKTWDRYVDDVGLCATSMLKGRRSLAAISDVVCM